VWVGAEGIQIGFSKKPRSGVGTAAADPPVARSGRVSRLGQGHREWGLGAPQRNARSTAPRLPYVLTSSQAGAQRVRDHQVAGFERKGLAVAGRRCVPIQAEASWYQDESVCVSLALVKDTTSRLASCPGGVHDSL
jgi:hypothetical protein